MRKATRRRPRTDARALSKPRSATASAVASSPAKRRAPEAMLRFRAVAGGRGDAGHSPQAAGARRVDPARRRDGGARQRPRAASPAASAGRSKSEAISRRRSTRFWRRRLAISVDGEQVGAGRRRRRQGRGGARGGARGRASAGERRRRDGIDKLNRLARGLGGGAGGVAINLVRLRARLDLALGRTNVIHAALHAGRGQRGLPRQSCAPNRRQVGRGGHDGRRRADQIKAPLNLKTGSWNNA